MKRKYQNPTICSEKSFETSALACGKYSDPVPGSWHFSTAYETYTGHFGPGMGASESISGSTGIGFGPGGTSNSYAYLGMCVNWVTFTS